MENKPQNIENIQRDNRAGYRVPEGYFSELNHKITSNTATSHTTSRVTIKNPLRKTIAFLVTAAIVTSAAFLGYNQLGSHLNTTETAQYDEALFVDLYNITMEDIAEMELNNQPAEPSESYKITEATIAYLDIYNYDITEMTDQ